MKILFGDRKDSDSVPMASLKQELSKLVKCDFVCPTAATSVKRRVNIDDYDIFILGPFVSDLKEWVGLENITIPKMMFCSDPQSDISFHVFYAKEYNIDHMLMIYPSWIPTYQESYNAKSYIPFPWWSDDYFKPVTKDINVMFSMANSPFYPVRFVMEQYYPHFKNDVGSSFRYGAAECRVPFGKYVESLNKSKLSVFDGSFWNLGVLKYVESMCLQTCSVAPLPHDAEWLKLTDYGTSANYVQISPETVIPTVKQLLKDEPKITQIAKNARDTFLKYHTTQIRAKQLVEIIQGLI